MTPAAASPQRLRVVLADPDARPRRALRELLQRSPGFVVAADADNGVDAVELVLHYRPEIALLDAALPRLDGVAATRRIAGRAREVRVVLLADAAADPGLQVEALRAGACGVVGKDVAPRALARTLRAVMRGEAGVSRVLTMRLIERLRGAPSAGNGMRPVRSPLTPREWEVLDLISAGATTAEVAMSLQLTLDTVHSHLYSVRRKLGVRNRAEAVRAAAELCAQGVPAE